MSELIIISGDRLFRAGLIRILADGGLKVTETSRLGGAAGVIARKAPLLAMIGPDQIPRRAPPDRDFSVATRNLRWVAFCSEDMPRAWERLLAAGAAGVIPTGTEPDLIRAAVHVVLAGGIYVPGPIARRSAAAPVMPLGLDGGAANAALTPRQAQVLELVGQGLSNKEIAAALDIAEGTARLHVSAILRWTGAANRTDLALRVARRSQAHPPSGARPPALPSPDEHPIYAQFDRELRLISHHPDYAALWGVSDETIHIGAPLAEITRRLADRGIFGGGSTAEIVEHRLWLARSARHIPRYLQRVGAEGPFMWFCRRLEADESITVTYSLAGPEASHGAF